MSRRVVVTGVGLVSPVGMGTQANWDALCAGTSGIGPITRFDATHFATRFAGEVKHFDPLQWIEKKELKKMDIFIQFAVAASQYAMDDARLTIDAALAPRIGVFIGSGIGGFTTIEEQHSVYLEGGPRKISPFFIPSSIINLAAGQVSIRFGAKGPNLATCTACTASAHAIGDSFEIIKRGAADAMITGGAEAALFGRVISRPMKPRVSPLAPLKFTPRASTVSKMPAPEAFGKFCTPTTPPPLFPAGVPAAHCTPN